MGSALLAGTATPLPFLAIKSLPIGAVRGTIVEAAIALTMLRATPTAAASVARCADVLLARRAFASA